MQANVSWLFFQVLLKSLLYRVSTLSPWVAEKKLRRQVHILQSEDLSPVEQDARDADESGGLMQMELSDGFIASVSSMQSSPRVRTSDRTSGSVGGPKCALVLLSKGAEVRISTLVLCQHGFSCVIQLQGHESRFLFPESSKWKATKRQSTNRTSCRLVTSVGTYSEL